MGKSKPKPRVEDHILDMDDPKVGKLCDAAKGPFDSMILICCLYCGMRVGELSHMKSTWWDGEAIKIPQSQPCGCYECRRRKVPGIFTPKTRRAVRLIPVHPQHRPFLNSFFETHKEFGLSRARVWQRLKAMQARAGIRGNIFPHALRGSYITDLLGKDVSEAIVRDLVGHESLATTGKYTRFSKERLVEALRRKAW